MTNNDKKTFRHSRYVAHFDVLGMTNAIRRDQDKAWGALSNYCSVQHDLDTKYSIICPVTGARVNNRSQTKLFSDTIIIFSLSDDIEDLYSIVFKSALLFCESLKACVSIRGGIAFGELYINLDLDMWLGKPLVDAYTLGESSQWLGIAVEDTVYEKASVFPNHSDQSLIVRWDLPMKGKDSAVVHKNTGVINWPAMFKPTVPLPVSIGSFYNPFETLFGPFDDLKEDVKQKYITTADFMNYQLTGSDI